MLSVPPFTSWTVFISVCTRSSKNSCVVIDVEYNRYYTVNIVIADNILYWCTLYCIYTVVLLLIYTVVYTAYIYCCIYCCIYCLLLLIYTVVYTVVYTAYTVFYCLYILLILLYILLILHHTAIHLQHVPGLWHQILFIAVIPALCSVYWSPLFTTVIYCV